MTSSNLQIKTSQLICPWSDPYLNRRYTEMNRECSWNSSSSQTTNLSIQAMHVTIKRKENPNVGRVRNHIILKRPQINDYKKDQDQCWSLPQAWALKMVLANTFHSVLSRTCFFSFPEVDICFYTTVLESIVFTWSFCWASMTPLIYLIIVIFCDDPWKQTIIFSPTSN